MLKAAGYQVAAVAGQRNQQYCKDLGADVVFDYKSHDVEQQIVHQLKGKPLAGVFCPIVDPSTIEVCARIAGQLDRRTSSSPCRLRTQCRTKARCLT